MRQSLPFLEHRLCSPAAFSRYLVKGRVSEVLPGVDREAGLPGPARRRPAGVPSARGTAHRHPRVDGAGGGDADADAAHGGGVSGAVTDPVVGDQDGDVVEVVGAADADARLGLDAARPLVGLPLGSHPGREKNCKKSCLQFVSRHTVLYNTCQSHTLVNKVCMHSFSLKE